MDNSKFENLNKFFDKVKSIGFFERVLSWKNISLLSYDAFQEFKSLSTEVYNLRENNKKIDYLKEDLNKINNELSISKNTIEQYNRFDCKRL